MKIILSPAKKMNTDTDSLAWRDLPRFLDRTERLCEILRGMSYDALKTLWKCNDQIAALNFERLQTMDLRKNLTPALLAYEGIQYRYMAPGVFSDRELTYAQDHVRILSGFYGIVRPFDGVVPYRLEMGAKLAVDGRKDLYAFWGRSLADALREETDTVIDIASKEYSRCVSAHKPPHVRMVTCVFGELNEKGKIVEKGTLCKMARGEMVAFMAEHDLCDPRDLRAFDRLNYRYAPEHSTENTMVFLLEKKTEAAKDMWS